MKTLFGFLVLLSGIVAFVSISYWVGYAVLWIMERVFDDDSLYDSDNINISFVLVGFISLTVIALLVVLGSIVGQTIF